MANQAPNPTPPPPTPLQRGLPWLIGLAIALYVVTLWAYFYGIGADRYGTIEATRPVLVFTLIVAMLGFGGLLIFFSLFARTQLGQNFSKAREIFLVFSGIFGTIIGFYFGAADEEAVAKAMTLTVSVAEGRQLSVAVEGGSGPFIGTITLPNQSAGTAVTSNERSLRFDIAEAACPAEARIVIFDGRGGRGEAKVEQAREALSTAGWTGCAAPAEPPPPPATPPGNAAENTIE